MKLIAGRDFLFVIQKEAEEKTNTGLYIPEEQQKKPSEGTVQSVGPQCTELKEGDIIRYGKGAGIPMEDGLILIREDDYLCKIEYDEADSAPK